MPRPSIAYEIIRKKNQKHIYLKIRDGKVVISASDEVSTSYIDKFVHSKSLWIQKHLQKISKSKLLTDKDATIYLLGKSYPVSIKIDKSLKNSKLEISQGTANFMLHIEPQEDILTKIRNNYYQSISHIHIAPLVEYYSQQMSLYPAKLSFRNNKSRWGSCSAANNISLNSKLMMLPKELIAYVVIHELSHIKHKNHGKEFWRLVEKYCPRYLHKRKSLRAYEMEL